MRCCGSSWSTRFGQARATDDSVGRDNRIAGLVITFTDITESKRANDAINEARIYAEAIVATARRVWAV